MRVKEESEKSGLKFNIQKTMIMASNPITLWQIEGEKVEARTDCIFLGSKITAGNDCSHKDKKHLLLGRKAMTNLDSILKSKEELKKLLMVKEESETSGLKFNIQKTKIMISDPITSWQIEGEKCGRSDRFYFFGLQNHCTW